MPWSTRKFALRHPYRLGTPATLCSSEYSPRSSSPCPRVSVSPCPRVPVSQHVTARHTQTPDPRSNLSPNGIPRPRPSAASPASRPACARTAGRALSGCRGQPVAQGDDVLVAGPEREAAGEDGRPVLALLGRGPVQAHRLQQFAAAGRVDAQEIPVAAADQSVVRVAVARGTVADRLGAGRRGVRVGQRQGGLQAAVRRLDAVARSPPSRPRWPC